MSAHSHMKDIRGIDCAPNQRASTWVPQIGISTPSLSFPSPTWLIVPLGLTANKAAAGLWVSLPCKTVRLYMSVPLGQADLHTRSPTSHCLGGLANSFKETPLQAQHDLESKEPGGGRLR